jgi:NitT/TauT family transport system substrate-binding protein
MHMLRRRFAPTLSAIACAAMLAPVSSLAQTTSPTIFIAAPPNDSAGPLFYAQDLGMFKKAGLNVSLQTIENPGTSVAAVVGGSLTIGTLTIPGIALAREKGLPIVMIAPGSIYSSKAPTAGIIVLRNSPIKKASDLNGKTIATRDITNMSYYGAKAWIDKNGGDSKTVKWLEVNEPAAVPALLAGRVDAASISEPALDDVIHGTDAQMLAPVYDAIGSRFMISGAFTTESYAKANPDVVRKFAEVMASAAAWGNKNHAESAKILAKYSGVDIKPGATRVAYAEQLPPSDAQPVLDMLRQYGVLKTAMRANDLFVGSRSQ